MCSKRCKHTLKERIPICAAERRCCEKPSPPPPPAVAAVCLLPIEETLDCNQCRPKSGSDVQATSCVCSMQQPPPPPPSAEQQGMHEMGPPENMMQTEFIQQQQQQQQQPLNEMPIEGSMIKSMIRESQNRFTNMKNNPSSFKYNNEQSTPTSIQHMDEWEAMAVMLATNGRIWSKEDIGFARQYKAALSAVNTKFEEEAANMTATPNY